MTRDLEKLLANLESDTSLFDAGQLGGRIEALDVLDAALAFESDAAVQNRALSMRDRLEHANATIYTSIREEIRRTGKSDGLLHWLNCLREPGETAPGLGYDVLDELIAGVLPIPEPGEVERTSAEQIFYQPTPVRHVLELTELTCLSPDDVLVDFGSGLGQLCIVASLLCGARTIGVEIEAAYVECARLCAERLGLKDRVSFLNADARQADLSTGTIFHLYTPFTGSTLRTVLDNLRIQAETRPIRVSTLGPCSEIVAREIWLRFDGAVDLGRIVLFRS